MGAAGSVWVTADGIFAPPPAPENAEDKPVKAPAPRRRIDKGKVLALHRAGWTNKAIAEEVRCSEASVSVIIKKEMK